MMAKAVTQNKFAMEWSVKGECPVCLTSSLFSEKNTTVADVLKSITGVETPRIFLIADVNLVQNTATLGTDIGKYVQAHNLSLAANPLVMSSGEKIKTDNFQTVNKILTAIAEADPGANDVMLVLGGGTLLDVAGYAASQICAGLKLVRVPTTIAAMADAAFAFTVSVNSPQVKDAFTVRSYPSAIIIDPTLARTNLDGVWRGGTGELVRYALMRDRALFKKIAKLSGELYNRSEEALTEILSSFIPSRIKKGATQFALWGAKRFEEMSNYRLPHGYSVPMAICAECSYAVEKGYFQSEVCDSVIETMFKLGALEGFVHSRDLFRRTSDILLGIDAWRHITGKSDLELPTELGKGFVETERDCDAFEKSCLSLTEAKSEGE